MLLNVTFACVFYKNFYPKLVFSVKKWKNSYKIIIFTHKCSGCRNFFFISAFMGFYIEDRLIYRITAKYYFESRKEPK